jgi:hypothetical protein|tara:strand:+ start:199 stop:312 length:114 start_codon:yes stop_codon:yes gene_type:complete
MKALLSEDMGSEEKGLVDWPNGIVDVFQVPTFLIVSE